MTSDRLIFQTGAELVRQDPVKGSEWFLSQELTELGFLKQHDDRLKSITLTWSKKDLKGATRWLESQLDNEDRDLAEAILSLQYRRKQD